MKKRFFLVSAVLFAAAIIFVLPLNAKATTSSGTANYRVIDISNNNGDINWDKLNGNVDAVYAKASEGYSKTDIYAPTYAKNAQQRGIPIGYYEYFWPSTDLSYCRQEADHFFSIIKTLGYSCVPALDVEETHDTDGNTLTSAQITASVQAFIDEFKAVSGVQDIMIYASQYFAKDNLQSSLSQYKLWVAKYKYSDITTWLDSYDCGAWKYWAMWQYSETGSVSGISGNVDMDMATAHIFLNIPSQRLSLDYPQSQVSGSFSLSGWALNRTGISRVDVYYDNNSWYGSIPVSSMYERPDVTAMFNQSGCYPDGVHSGFSTTIPYGYFSAGTHTLRVAAIGTDGSVQWATTTFTVKKVSPINCIDAPGGSVAGDVTIAGWAVNDSKISRVDIYADLGSSNSFFVGSTGAHAIRPDVAAAINSSGLYSYALSDGCGYAYVAKAGTFTNGKHTIYTAAIGCDGTVQWSSTTINYNIPLPITCIDYPAASEKCYSDIGITGWAVSYSGISRIDVYADVGSSSCKYLGSESSLGKRDDVIAAVDYDGRYPDAKTRGTAFTINVSSSMLTTGTHVLAIAAISNDGSVQWRTVTISVGPETQMCLDNPSIGLSASGSVLISGWGVSHALINRFDFYADIDIGKPVWLGSTSNIYARDDVAAAINTSGKYTNALKNGCGFGYVADISSLSPGKHTIYAAAICGDGTVVWRASQIYVK